MTFETCRSPSARVIKLGDFTTITAVRRPPQYRCATTSAGADVGVG